MRRAGVGFAVFAVLGLAGWLAFLSSFPTPHPPLRLPTGASVLRDVTLHVSPTEVREHVDLLVVDGRIAAIGAGLTAPAGAKVLCERCVVTAGFWNAHVHFTEPAWRDDDAIAGKLRDLFSSRGFTTVVDTGSDLRVTLKVRGLVQAGEQLGPTIITAGTGLFPPDGLPYYLKNSIPRPLQWLMPQPETPAAARRAVATNAERGADLLKLFTGSWVERGHVKPMPLEVARAAVEQAHARGALAFAHPSNLEGTRVALEAGVDVLAHAPDATEGIDDALLATLVAHHVAMVPTLKMFATTVKTDPAYLAPIHDVVRRFHALGGTLLFGTDVGYMTDPDTTDEFVALADCGLSFSEVLAMLTTAPATRFAGKPSGTVEVGGLADLVLFETDPALALTTLAHPLATVRAGRLTFSR